MTVSAGDLLFLVGVLSGIAAGVARDRGRRAGASPWLHRGLQLVAISALGAALASLFV